jgi:hypothetical protein
MTVLQAALVVAALTTPVNGADDVRASMSRGELMSIIRTMGYSQVRENGYSAHGKPQATYSVGNTNIGIMMWQCNELDSDCQSFKLYAAYAKPDAVSYQDLNTFNRQHRFVRAYLDSTGNPYLELDVKVSDGVSVDNLRETFSIYHRVVQNFEQLIGWSQRARYYTPRRMTGGDS